jgi:DNA-binding MarR family transcriptional regulator
MSNYIVEVKTDHVIALIAGIREKAYRFLVRELSLRGIDGLAPSHGAILSTLYNHGPVSMQELARRIDRDKSTVTALVKKLQDHGYVERAADPADGRVSIIHPTARALALRPGFEEISQRLIATAYQGFDQEERETLVRGLEKMLDAFQKEADSPQA